MSPTDFVLPRDHNGEKASSPSVSRNAFTIITMNGKFLKIFSDTVNKQFAPLFIVLYMSLSGLSETVGSYVQRGCCTQILGTTKSDRCETNFFQPQAPLSLNRSYETKLRNKTENVADMLIDRSISISTIRSVNVKQSRGTREWICRNYGWSTNPP